MKKRTLTIKFTIIFSLFTIITLFISAIFSMINQTRVYKQQREESVQFVASYLEDLLIADDIYFIWYQKYFLEHADKFLVPSDFDAVSIQDARHDYEEKLSEEYPGLVLGTDIDFDDLSEETKIAYEIYSHEYYLAAFENAREKFDLTYLYYMVPVSDDSDEIIYVLDSNRFEKTVEGKSYIDLGITQSYPKSKYTHLWEAWNTGVRPKGYDILEKKHGKTYAFYTPLFINGQKLGIINVEVDVSAIIHKIHTDTLRNMSVVGSVLIVFSFFLLLYIRSRYIKKLVRLSENIEKYSSTKDTKIAEALTKDVTNDDEISIIMSKFADMIYELDSYMKSLSKTTMALNDTQQKAMKFSVLAIKDSLTGIRNKTGYDEEINKLKKEMAKGFKDFGVAMVDLNYLKRINDTFGHDKGNFAIVTLCQIICHTFPHSPVFRIGGDEFVVILQGLDFEHVDELIEEFNKMIKDRENDSELEFWEQTSAALGYSAFNPDSDTSYEEVFKRADAEMYKNKKAMKAARE